MLMQVNRRRQQMVGRGGMGELLGGDGADQGGLDPGSTAGSYPCSFPHFLSHSLFGPAPGKWLVQISGDSSGQWRLTLDYPSPTGCSVGSFGIGA